MKEKSNYSEERLDLIVGLITVLVVLALFAWLLVGIGRRTAKIDAANTVGEISTLGVTRRGGEQIFTYEPNQTDIVDGAAVYWTIDGERVYEGAYTHGEPITFAYTPTEMGTLEVIASVGKYHQTITVDVLAPQLTLTAPNVTIVYGDNLPKLNYDVCGFVEGDDTSDFCYEGNCVANCDKLNVGVYELTFDSELNYRDYETEYVCGTLTVLPKQLQVTNRFTKLYDATNTIQHPTINLNGVVQGDEVKACCDVLYFDNKNVGNDKTIMLANVTLEGKDACNYVLPDYICGNITPRALKLTGLTVKDKFYDGTTKATIERMGTLNGVMTGDSVAIGNINVSFENADVGEQKIATNGITLIGADRDNYTVVVDNTTAQISNKSSLWEKLFDKEPLALGNL